MNAREVKFRGVRSVSIKLRGVKMRSVRLMGMRLKSGWGKVAVKCGILAGLVVCFPWIVTLLLTGEYKGKGFGMNSGDYYVIVDDRKVGIEDFVAYALVKQIDVGAEEEALKAQGVIVRTYIYEKMASKNVKEINVNKLDLEYITYEEMESIWKEEFPEKFSKLMRVVEATYGQVIMYEGEPIKPYFHNVSCGYTRSGAFLGDEYKYLVSVQSVGDVDSENYQSGVSFSKEDFVKKLRKANDNIALSIEVPLETMQVIKRDKGGYVEELQIGNVVMTGDEFVNVFKLNSPNFQVEESDGQIRIITKGLGHGIGLSIYGAKSLAKSGKTYTEILQHYYSEVYLEPLWEE